MMKLLGSLCVFSAGGMLWSLRRRERKRQRALLCDLAAALAGMASEIRLCRTPLPALLIRASQGCGAETAAFFRAAARAVRASEPFSAAWNGGLSALPLAESDRQTLAALPAALQGDEESACKALSLASQTLKESLFQLKNRQPEEDRRSTALCFSAAALVVILLI